MLSMLSSVVLYLHAVLVHSEITPEGYDPECTIQDEADFDFYQCDATFSKNYYCSLSLEQQDWLQSIWQEALKDRSYRPRKRREIRTLSEKEKTTFFKAINQLKTDTVCIVSLWFFLIVLFRLIRDSIVICICLFT